MVMFAKLLWYALSKAQIVAFFGLPHNVKETKKLLVERLLCLYEANAVERARLLDTFPYELAVNPVELQELLACTPTERRRWVGEGKIPILEYRPFRMAGRDLVYPVHDRRIVLALSQEEIAHWRELHRVQVRENRRAGAVASRKSREDNQRAREAFQASWQAMMEGWQQNGTPDLVAALRLAYWTVYASRWAKENHLKALRGTKHTTLHAARRETWYGRKNEALRILVRTPYVRLTFYRPPNPDKHVLSLCDEHYEEKRDGFYLDKWEFYEYNTSAVEGCKDCIVRHEQDFYSLYSVEVAAQDFPDLRFSFHTPYPIGKSWLPLPHTLPMVEHIEQDGIFRFGRALFDAEKITHREQDVLKHLDLALEDAKRFYP
jgi:hypothetical protein